MNPTSFAKSHSRRWRLQANMIGNHRFWAWTVLTIPPSTPVIDRTVRRSFWVSSSSWGCSLASATKQALFANGQERHQLT